MDTTKRAFSGTLSFSLVFASLSFSLFFFPTMVKDICQFSQSIARQKIKDNYSCKRKIK